MKLIKRTDIIIIFAVILSAALISIPKFLSSDKITAEIYVDGSLYRSVNLADVDKKYTIDLATDPHVEITVDKGEIYFSHAECKDKLCVQSGKLSSGGETAACLPAKVVISLKSTKDKTDIMTY